jgi:hypothetical protein
LNNLTRYKSVIIAWLAFDILSALLFAVAVSELTFVKFAASAALFMAGTAAALALVATAPAGPGAPPPLVSAAAALAALAYLPLAAAVSVVFMVGAATGLAALVLIELLLFALFVAASFGLYWAAKRKAVSDAATERRASGVYGLLSRAEALLGRLPAGSPEARSLERTVEEIRYFDKNSSVATDREIAERLMDLDEIYNPRPDSPAPPPAPAAPAASPGDPVLESLDFVAPGALPSGGEPPVPPATSPAPSARAADPAAQRANAAELLEELYRLTLRRKDDSLAAKRGAL